MTAMISGSALEEVLARPRSAQHGLQATAAELTPLLDGSGTWVHRIWVAAAFLLGAISRDALGDPDAVRPALERALDLAEADEVLVDLLARMNRPLASPPEPALPREALTRCEERVLRYLPTNLSAGEIAGELYLSRNTVKTHQRHVYQKLGVSSRTQAVERARALGLLSPSRRGRSVSL